MQWNLTKTSLNTYNDLSVITAALNPQKNGAVKVRNSNGNNIAHDLSLNRII